MLIVLFKSLTMVTCTEDNIDYLLLQVSLQGTMTVTDDYGLNGLLLEASQQYKAQAQLSDKEETIGWFW